MMWSKLTDPYRPFVEQALEEYKNGRLTKKQATDSVLSNMGILSSEVQRVVQVRDHGEFAQDLVGTIAKYDPDMAHDLHEVWENRAKS